MSYKQINQAIRTLPGDAASTLHGVVFDILLLSPLGLPSQSKSV
jgi:hypothetical protein